MNLGNRAYWGVPTSPLQNSKSDTKLLESQMILELLVDLYWDKAFKWQPPSIWHPFQNHWMSGSSMMLPIFNWKHHSHQTTIPTFLMCLGITPIRLWQLHHPTKPSVWFMRNKANCCHPFPSTEAVVLKEKFAVCHFRPIAVILLAERDKMHISGIWNGESWSQKPSHMITTSRPWPIPWKET